jgi:hypothetical protein
MPAVGEDLLASAAVASISSGEAMNAVIAFCFESISPVQCFSPPLAGRKVLLDD